MRFDEKIFFLVLYLGNSFLQSLKSLTIIIMMYGQTYILCYRFPISVLVAAELNLFVRVAGAVSGQDDP